MKPPKPDARAAILIARQRMKMSRSAQTYVRGSTKQFYAWLSQDGQVLPTGPSIWICGDCHYGNLGPVANAKGEVSIQIRDLDQTVVGNPVHDVIRLAFSLASAARGFDLPGVATARMVEQIVDGYQHALTGERADAADKPPVIKGLLNVSRHRGWSHLAKERIDDLRPEIPLGKRFWPLSKAERDMLVQLVASEPIRELMGALHSRESEGELELLDAAYWVKGCSSLGLLRYAVLVGVGSGKSREPGLIDVKEAVRAAAPRAADAPVFRDHGERVVTGARALSPALGERMRPAHLGEHYAYVRELLPQDMKLEMESLSLDEAVTVARFLAGVVGRAHGRQMSDEDRKRWAAELDHNRSKSLDAPSWLWSAVVELMSIHEGAYLEHCRRYANVAA